MATTWLNCCGSKARVLRFVNLYWKKCLCIDLFTTQLDLFKGTMSPQAHARIDEKHFEIVGPTFSNTVGEFRELFASV